jgi:branched-chain amino acid transport system permease protein
MDFFRFGVDKMTAMAVDLKKKTYRSVVATLFCSLAVLTLLLLPVAASYADTPYYVVLMTRSLVFAVAATALNLVLGFGGMVSFGHALFMGIGAYSVAICVYFGITNGWCHLALAIVVSALAAAATGAIALRTRGVAFIMITLAFAQMFYFLMVSLKEFGGDDGLPIRSSSSFGGVTLGEPVTLYYVVFAVLAVIIYGNYRLYHSSFGLVLRGCMINEDRMKALGYPTITYKLVAYMISGTIAGVAGFFLANLTLFASPSYASWIVSGDLMIMVVLGGTGTLMGPAFGAFAFLLIEELLKRITSHWIGGVGAVIVLVGLLARRGLWGLLQERRR